jgi:hypothetical protein
MKKIIIAVLISLLPTTFAGFPAQADTCVSAKEFYKIKQGMSEAQVKKITGTNGKADYVSGSGKWRVVGKQYKTCERYGYVGIVFMGGKLHTKSGFFPSKF